MRGYASKGYKPFMLTSTHLTEEPFFGVVTVQRMIANIVQAVKIYYKQKSRNRNLVMHKPCTSHAILRTRANGKRHQENAKAALPLPEVPPWAYKISCRQAKAMQQTSLRCTVGIRKWHSRHTKVAQSTHESGTVGLPKDHCGLQRRAVAQRQGCTLGNTQYISHCAARYSALHTKYCPKNARGMTRWIPCEF